MDCPLEDRYLKLLYPEVRSIACLAVQDKVYYMIWKDQPEWQPHRIPKYCNGGDSNLHLWGKEFCKYIAVP